MEFYAKLTGELAASPAGRRLTRTTAARPVTIIWNTSYDPKTAQGVKSASAAPKQCGFIGEIPPFSRGAPMVSQTTVLDQL
jgi:hypothetical protein